MPAFYDVSYNPDGTLGAVVPSHPAAKSVITKRIVKDLDEAEYPTKPIVPYLEIVHDRIMLELFRGCTRGCRFCQAGIIYRPVRERRPETLIRLAQQLVDSTGYNEISLTSLSSADYSCLNDTVHKLIAQFDDQGVSVSLPSLRIDSFSIELANEVQKVRKSGLTFAPEAGTQRLRDVINKGVTEKDLEEAVGAAFRAGWSTVKLYFMIGLPTETDEDIRGIAHLAYKVLELYKQIKGRRGAKVTVSVSSFVPKPHTAFQWYGQIPPEEMERKQQLLRSLLKDRGISFNWHDSKVSFLEGVFARGDRRLGQVLLAAWRQGAKFDGWSEHFKYELWQDALSQSESGPKFYAQRERDMAEVLPWDHLSAGEDKSFLKQEYEQAITGAATNDCRRGSCQACGVCQGLGVDIIDWGGPGMSKMRLDITKGEAIRYISHLDFARLMERALRRAKLPVAYSEGFNPHMKMAFASALSLGVTSDAEYLDVEISDDLSVENFSAALAAQLPAAVVLKRVRSITANHKSLSALINLAAYSIFLPAEIDIDVAGACVKRFNEAAQAIYVKQSPKGKREIDVKQYVVKDVVLTPVSSGAQLDMLIRITPTGSVKPSGVLSVLVEQFGLAVDPIAAIINRTGLFVQNGSSVLSPLDSGV